MRVLITSWRFWDDSEAVFCEIDRVIEEATDTDITFVHGACPTGGDHIADVYLNGIGWPARIGKTVTVERHPALWDDCAPDCPPRPHRIVKKPDDIHHPGLLPDYCPGAGRRRNVHMIGLGADECLAFLSVRSRGAVMTARLAKAAGIDTKPIYLADLRRSR